MLQALILSTLLAVAVAEYTLEATAHIKLVDACSQAPDIAHVGLLMGSGYGLFYIGSTGDNPAACGDVSDVGPVTIWTGDSAGCVEAPLTSTLFGNTANLYDAEIDGDDYNVSLACYDDGVLVNTTYAEDWTYSSGSCTTGTDGPIISPSGSCYGNWVL